MSTSRLAGRVFDRGGGHLSRLCLTHQTGWPLIEPSLLWTDAWGLLSGQWWTAEVHPRVGVPPHHLPQPIRGQHLVLVG